MLLLFYLSNLSEVALFNEDGPCKRNRVGALSLISREVWYPNIILRLEDKQKNDFTVDTM